MDPDMVLLQQLRPQIPACSSLKEFIKWETIVKHLQVYQIFSYKITISPHIACHESVKFDIMFYTI